MHSSSDPLTKLPSILYFPAHLASEFQVPQCILFSFQKKDLALAFRAANRMSGLNAFLCALRKPAYMRTKVARNVSSIMPERDDALPKKQGAYSRNPTDHAA